MTKTEIADYLASLTDTDLLDAMQEARDDMANAAREGAQSTRYAECFAALTFYKDEVRNRGLSQAVAKRAHDQRAASFAHS